MKAPSRRFGGLKTRVSVVRFRPWPPFPADLTTTYVHRWRRPKGATSLGKGGPIWGDQLLSVSPPPTRSTGVDKKSSYRCTRSGSATPQTEFCEPMGQASAMTAALLLLVLGTASPTVGPHGSVTYPCRLPAPPALSVPATEPSARVALVSAPRECSREGSVVKPPRRSGRR